MVMHIVIGVKNINVDRMRKRLFKNTPDTSEMTFDLELATYSEHLNILDRQYEAWLDEFRAQMSAKHNDPNPKIQTYIIDPTQGGPLRAMRAVYIPPRK